MAVRPVLMLSAVMSSALVSPASDARHATALWDVVHRLCVPDRRITGLPFPCIRVNRKAGYAVVKDVGPTGYLLVPTRRLTGIEDPRLGDPGVPNYWAAAWAARRLVERRARSPLPREDLGMAINGRIGRSQDQLHIHVDCVRQDVRDALAAWDARAGSGWEPLLLRGHPYDVRRVTEREMDERDPFRLVETDHAWVTMAPDGWTMAVIGRAATADAEPGLFLVAATSAASRGHAEELLDHACSVARRVRRRRSTMPSTGL